MKIVNPLGRNLKMEKDGEIKPAACMCRTGISFSSALGDADNCSHCGCNCWPHNHGANASTASNTSRASV
jgi:putative bacteriocin precursor